MVVDGLNGGATDSLKVAWTEQSKEIEIVSNVKRKHAELESQQSVELTRTYHVAQCIFYDSVFITGDDWHYLF